MKAARRLLAWLGLCASILALLATPASAAVDLLYFRGTTQSDRIFLEWETATELDNAGFQVRRSTQGGTFPSLYTPVPLIDATSGTPFTFIPARGDSLLGAYYPFYDENVLTGTRYYYYLQDVDSSNFSSYHGPIEVVAGQTNTPTPTLTNSPTPKTPTLTPSPTSAGPSATPSPVSATSTTTAAASPAASTSPTSEATLEPNITPLNATQTAIALALTNLPTATRTPVPLAQAASPTATQTAAPFLLGSATPEPGQPGGVGGENFGRLALVIALFLGSGALLTGGIIFLARRSREVS